MAIAWTLLIFFLCFLPARDIPNVDIPLADKWAHFVLFGVLCFLWLLSLKNAKLWHCVAFFLFSLALGWFVEGIQHSLSFLGRSYDEKDVLADGIGGFLGAFIFYLAKVIRRKPTRAHF